jgi:hypothetical protein
MKVSVPILAVCFATLSPAGADAASLVEPASGSTFDGHPTSAGRSYVCLGAGVRKYLFWQLYAMDFCVEESKARVELEAYLQGKGRRHAGLRGPALAAALREDPVFFEQLASMPLDKRAEMVFLRRGGAETVRGSFRKNLEKSLGTGRREEAAIEDFVSPIDRDVSPGDRAEFRTSPGGGVTFALGAREKVLVQPGADVKFWQAYLGPDSPVSSLKDAVARGVADLISH